MLATTVAVAVARMVAVALEPNVAQFGRVIGGNVAKALETSGSNLQMVEDWGVILRLCTALHCPSGTNNAFHDLRAHNAPTPPSRNREAGPPGVHVQFPSENAQRDHRNHSHESSGAGVRAMPHDLHPLALASAAWPHGSLEASYLTVAHGTFAQKMDGVLIRSFGTLKVQSASEVEGGMI